MRRAERASGGIKGEVIINVLDARGAPGGGRADLVTMADILKMPIKRVTRGHNMVLRRGLSYIQYRMFGDHNSPDTVSNVSYNPTTNPFAYFTCSDGNNRVAWDESDTEHNPNAGTAVRSCGVSDTAGVFKLVSKSQKDAPPYKTLELVFYVQPSAGTSYPKGLDDFIIKSIGLTEGPDAYYGATQDRWGMRSVLGRPPRYLCITGLPNLAEPAVGGGSDPLPINTGTLVDSYVESGHAGSNSGDNAFDGSTADYSLTGSVNLGGEWESDTTVPAFVGRVWDDDKQISGARVTVPAGSNINTVPRYFKFQYLTGTDPTNDLHWTDIPGADYMASAQDTNIYGGEEFGKEYSWSAVTTKGIRMMSISPVSGLTIRIAELCIHGVQTFPTFVSGVNDRLRLAVDAAGTVFRNFDIGNYVATSTSGLAALIDSLLAGYEMEAIRDTFGFLVIQATPNGGNSKLKVDANTGSTANDDLGITARYTSTPSQQVGTDVPVTKAVADAMTITYRQSIDLTK